MSIKDLFQKNINKFKSNANSIATASFDVESKEFVLAKKQENSDFIMVNHNLDELAMQCNRAFLLHKGNLIEFKDVNEGIIQHRKFLEQK